MHTSEVLRMLFDDNSFMQIGAREDENVIIGYGTIGRAVGAIAQALGMRLLVNARHAVLPISSGSCALTVWPSKAKPH